jgi:hypothetical protein
MIVIVVGVVVPGVGVLGLLVGVGVVIVCSHRGFARKLTRLRNLKLL